MVKYQFLAQILHNYFTFGGVFHTSVSWWFYSGVSGESKSPQISRTLLNILSDLNNSVVWIVSTSSNFPVLQSLYQYFRDCSECSDYNWYHYHLHVPYLSLFPLSFNLFFGLPGWRSPLFGWFSFFCWRSQGLVVWPKLDELLVPQNHRELCASHSPRGFLGWAYTTRSNAQIYPADYRIKLKESE